MSTRGHKAHMERQSEDMNLKLPNPVILSHTVERCSIKWFFYFDEKRTRGTFQSRLLQVGYTQNNPTKAVGYDITIISWTKRWFWQPNYNGLWVNTPNRTHENSQYQAQKR